MLNRESMPAAYLKTVKRHLKITWEDTDTNENLIDKMLDAETELNHILGVEVDYFEPGMARRLYMDFMLYIHNDCRNEFEDAYRKEIIRLRNFYAVKGAKNEE